MKSRIGLPDGGRTHDVPGCPCSSGCWPAGRRSLESRGNWWWQCDCSSRSDAGTYCTPYGPALERVLYSITHTPYEPALERVLYSITHTPYEPALERVLYSITHTP